MAKDNGIAQKWLDKYLGRYFLAWVIATVLLCFKILDSQSWIWVTGFFFIGGAASGISNNIKETNNIYK